MSLTKIYQDKSTEFLVNLLEHREDYTPEAAMAAKSELHRRKLDQDDLRSIARGILNREIRIYLANFDVVNDKLVLPRSHFLNEEEVKAQFMTIFAQWKAENDDRIPEAWKYVIAAGFGF